MAETQSMYKPVILLALIACHAIFSTEGRQLKSIMNTKQVMNSATGETAKQGSINSSINSPLATKSFKDSEASYKDDFRPTSPGNRTAIGHSSAHQDPENFESKVVHDNSQKAGHFKTEAKDDFRPTTPGHSPGIGHAFRTKNVEPNSKRHI